MRPVYISFLNGPDIAALAMHPEIFLLGAVFRHGIERGGVRDQLAVGVERLDRAEMTGVRGMVEQDQVQDRPGDAADLRHHEVARHRAQRQVVDLDVAADVGIDAGGYVLQRLPGQGFLAASHVEHDAGANRGKADHGRDGGGDQQLCRKLPWPSRPAFAPSKSHAFCSRSFCMQQKRCRRLKSGQPCASQLTLPFRIEMKGVPMPRMQYRGTP